MLRYPRYMTTVVGAHSGPREVVSCLAGKAVKVTMTGPNLLSAVACDEYYNDISRMIGDDGMLLRQNSKRLTEAYGAHRGPRMARTRADHDDQHMRAQSSAPTHCVRKVKAHDPGQSDPERSMKRLMDS